MNQNVSIPQVKYLNRYWQTKLRLMQNDSGTGGSSHQPHAPVCSVTAGAPLKVEGRITAQEFGSMINQFGVDELTPFFQ